MGKRIQAIKRKLGIPSGKALIHLVLAEIIINAIWNQVSKMFTIALVREIGFLVVFVAGLFIVAWYLPKLSPILGGRTTSTSQKQRPNRPRLEYSPKVVGTLSTLIKRGEGLTDQMQRPDFHTGRLGLDVRQWQDNVEHNVWEVLSAHADYITAEQGVITEDERIRYNGWGSSAVSLRISVDRLLARLRQTRSEIQAPDKEVSQH